MDNQHKQITGYRDLSQQEIDIVNRIKAHAEETRRLLDDVRGTLRVDGGLQADSARWFAIAQTDLQKGFMSLVRAITQPTTF